MVVPHIHDIGVLAIQDHVGHKAHRPLHGAERRLALPALIVLAVHDAKRPDQVLYNVLDVIECIHLTGITRVPLAVEMKHEVVPLAPDVRYERADLQPCQQVIERGEVDEGIDRRAEPSPLQRLVVEPRADLGVSVQPHHKGQVPLVHGVAHPKAVVVHRLRQPQRGDDLLYPMRDIKVGRLAGQEPGLAVGIGRDVPQQRAVVVDPRVRRVVQGGG